MVQSNQQFGYKMLENEQIIYVYLCFDNKTKKNIELRGKKKFKENFKIKYRDGVILIVTEREGFILIIFF
jgi:hypothetical protein